MIHKRKRLQAILLVQMLGAALLHAQAPKPADGFEERDRLLLKAEDSADSKPWRDVITPDFIFITEASQIIHAPDFLRALSGSAGGESVPPPEMRDYSVAVTGDAAIVTFFVWETGEHLGSPLTGHSIVTETWQLLAGHWKLRLVHMTSVPVPPPAVSLTAAELQELAGTYKAAESVQTIQIEHQKIMVAEAGEPAHEVKAETADVLFSPGTPRMRMVFQRDPSGHIAGFAYRNENRSVYFKRVP